MEYQEGGLRGNRTCGRAWEGAEVSNMESPWPEALGRPGLQESLFTDLVLGAE